MKKLLSLAFALLLFAIPAFAANSSSSCDGGVDEGYNNQVRKVTCEFTADDTTGAFDTVTFTAYGYVEKVVTNPGTVPPDDNYDIAITDADGANICSTNLDNRDTANSEQTLCVSGHPVWLSGVNTITITGNTAVSATTKLKIWYRRFP